MLLFFQTYVAGMQAEIPVLADKPEGIAATVLEVSTDGTDKHLYIAVKHAIDEYNQ
ncbi:hypothetical protein [Rhizosphaericola mali]|uniref:hypothetical protein n=1 Tax=Rhizosphaericola mali TaxID=2545455 RepID=UPI00177D1027|nr:hypothetical protein [Rhizosphaericola mali]